MQKTGVASAAQLDWGPPLANTQQSTHLDCAIIAACCECCWVQRAEIHRPNALVMSLPLAHSATTCTAQRSTAQHMVSTGGQVQVRSPDVPVISHSLQRTASDSMHSTASTCCLGHDSTAQTLGPASSCHSKQPSHQPHESCLSSNAHIHNRIVPITKHTCQIPKLHHASIVAAQQVLLHCW